MVQALFHLVLKPLKLYERRRKLPLAERNPLLQGLEPGETHARLQLGIELGLVDEALRVELDLLEEVVLLRDALDELFEDNQPGGFLLGRVQCGILFLPRAQKPLLEQLGDWVLLFFDPLNLF